MWRFKPSKYKNAAPKILKKEEWIADVSANKLLDSCGNHIWASATHIAFNTETAGGCAVGILPLNSKGRRSNELPPMVQAHTEVVNDCDFSPFDDNLLATCSRDCTVKLWQLPDEMTENIFEAHANIATEAVKVENVKWNPLASGILAASSGGSIKVYDVSSQQTRFAVNIHSEQMYSFSWNGNGSMMVTSGKDQRICIVDPRQTAVAQETAGHHSIRDCKVQWLGNKDQIISTGFDSMRQREICLRDIRNFSTNLTCRSLDTATGVLIPLYDPDTGMLFLVAKGDNAVKYCEVLDKDPYIAENANDNISQVRGICLVPKRAMDVMKGEVNRLLIMSQSNIIPVPFIVPRKSYCDFHSDIFPDTFCGEASMTSEQWISGENIPGKVKSLNPNAPGGVFVSPPPQPAPAPVQQPPPVIQMTAPESTPESASILREKTSQPDSGLEDPTANRPGIISPKPKLTPKPLNTNGAVEERPVSPNPSLLRHPGASRPRSKVFSGVRTSKFRHLKGTTAHKDTHITNLRNLSKSMPCESDIFHANTKYCAVPLGGPGGIIAILKTDGAGKLPDVGVPSIQCGALVTDFVFDPFDNDLLVVACDNAKILEWRIPEGGYTGMISTPTGVLIGHREKVYFVRFHPMAKSILVSASYDMSVRIWNMDTKQTVIQLAGHNEAVFCVGWSLDGARCITGCKDGKLRMYDPRVSPDPIQEGVGPGSTRGARVVWACNDKLVVVSGFDKQSTRLVSVYKPEDLSAPVHFVSMAVSPSILIPHYDEDSSTLFLTGKGDGSMKAFEVSMDMPHLFELSTHKCSSAHQAFSFLPKSECNVRKVEFAHSLRLTLNGIEPVIFTVPRVKMQYFQDDLFPNTKVTWEPALSAADWLSGVNQPLRVISLKPDDMQNLTEETKSQPVKPPKYDSSFLEYKQTNKTEDQRKDELLSSMTNKMEVQDQPLPQDLTQGVEANEWE